MNISKLTITSICSQYEKSNIMQITKPSAQRAADLINERLYARDGFCVGNGLPRFMSNVVPPNELPEALRPKFVEPKNLVASFLAEMSKKLGPFLNK